MGIRTKFRRSRELSCEVWSLEGACRSECRFVILWQAFGDNDKNWSDCTTDSGCFVSEYKISNCFGTWMWISEIYLRV